jgi:hypothetical protein
MLELDTLMVPLLCRWASTFPEIYLYGGPLFIRVTWPPGAVAVQPVEDPEQEASLLETCPVGY